MTGAGKGREKKGRAGWREYAAADADYDAVDDDDHGERKILHQYLNLCPRRSLSLFSFFFFLFFLFSFSPFFLF